MNKNMFLLVMLSLAFGMSAEMQNSSTVSDESTQRKTRQPAQRILSEPQEAKPVSGSTDSSWKLTQQKKENTAEQENKEGTARDKAASDGDKK